MCIAWPAACVVVQVDPLMASRMATWVVWGVINWQRKMDAYAEAQTRCVSSIGRSSNLLARPATFCPLWWQLQGGGGKRQEWNANKLARSYRLSSTSIDQRHTPDRCCCMCSCRCHWDQDIESRSNRDSCDVSVGVMGMGKVQSATQSQSAAHAVMVQNELLLTWLLGGAI